MAVVPRGLKFMSPSQHHLGWSVSIYQIYHGDFQSSADDPSLLTENRNASCSTQMNYYHYLLSVTDISIYIINIFALIFAAIFETYLYKL